MRVTDIELAKALVLFYADDMDMKMTDALLTMFQVFHELEANGEFMFAPQEMHWTYYWLVVHEAGIFFEVEGCLLDCFDKDSNTLVAAACRMSECPN